MMKRRSFLKSLLAAIAAPAIPIPKPVAKQLSLKGWKMVFDPFAPRYFMKAGKMVRVWPHIEGRSKGKPVAMINPEWYDAPYELNIFAHKDSILWNGMKERLERPAGARYRCVMMKRTHPEEVDSPYCDYGYEQWTPEFEIHDHQASCRAPLLLT